VLKAYINIIFVFFLTLKFTFFFLAYTPNLTNLQNTPFKRIEPRRTPLIGQSTERHENSIKTSRWRPSTGPPCPFQGHRTFNTNFILVYPSHFGGVRESMKSGRGSLPGSCRSGRIPWTARGRRCRCCTSR
jgi:hypothetical protein